MEPHRLTATQALHKIRGNELTVEDYAKSLLKRIERRDSIVKAWAYLDPVQVLNEARRLDRIPVNRRGPLHGLPVGVKDVIYTKGMYIYPMVYWYRKIANKRDRHANAAQFTSL